MMLNLISNLSTLSGIDNDIDKEMSNDVVFEKDGKAFIKTLENLEKEIDEANMVLANIKYSKIFTKKHLMF